MSSLLFNFTETIDCTSYDQFIEEVEDKFSDPGETMWTGKYIRYEVKDVNIIPRIKGSKYYESGGNLELILDDLEKNIGREVYVRSGEIGKLSGVEITHEDYYWIVDMGDNKTQYLSCVGRIDFV